MRGSQSDPTHTYAPVCPCLGVMLRACAHDMTHGRAWARVWRGYNDWISGPTARFWARAMRWHRRVLFLALLAHFGALLGLCGGLAMLGRARAGLRCLFSLDECTVLGAHTVCLAYGLAYVLAYGIARARLALGVWFSAHGGLLQRLPKQATRRGKVAMLSIHRIMKPC